MAHVYTTARGKTKKAKETVRKDAKNNAANKLMSKVVKEPKKAQTYDNVDFFAKLAGGDAEGRRTIEAAAKTKIFTPENDPKVIREDILTKAIINVRVQLPSYQRCFYELCATDANNGSSSVFKHCSRCRIARYCSADCQKNDWHRIHKAACGKSDLLAVGSSVAIRPQSVPLLSLSSLSTLYPPPVCQPPANEIHGVVVSVSSSPSLPPSTSSTPSPIPDSLRVELFDCELIPSGEIIEVPAGDVVVSGWGLEQERALAGEKKKQKEEARKRQEKREKVLEAEERERQERLREKKEREMERQKRELEKKAGGVSVDWGLFNEALDDIADDG